MSVPHLTLHFLDQSHVRLRYFFDNPNVFDERVAAESELTELKRLSKIVYDGERIEKSQNSDQELMAVGRALYDWLDTPERILTGKIAACPRGPEPLVLAVAATPELKDLPWETLHDGAGFLVAREARAVIPVRWRDVAAAPANRRLRTLFMATSPEGVQPVLAFEAEEKAILEATRRHPLTLTVEESGDVTELKFRVAAEPDAAIDVFHVTGHAGHDENGVPVFLTEDAEGGLKLSTAADFADALVRMPPLLFLSGCRTAQSPGDALPSLAEAMPDKGAQAVLGWGRPVYDTNGIAAAAALYGALAGAFAGEGARPNLSGAAPGERAALASAAAVCGGRHARRAGDGAGNAQARESGGRFVCAALSGRGEPNAGGLAGRLHRAPSPAATRTQDAARG
jgi:hypothetical protein